MSAGGGEGHILQSLLVNATIATAKAVAAAVTGSGAMVAEAIHSASDCANQLLLLMGVRRARRPADELHPLGYGRVLYFWSFIVALLLFTGGGVFSVYEGIHKLEESQPVENAGVAVGILLFSLALEGWATAGNLEELRRRRGATPLFRYLRETKDSDLVVVFGENAAAVVGLAVALVAVGLAELTGDPAWDAAGSIGIGVVLIAVAIFLGTEVKSLLIGERADPTLDAAVRAVVGEDPHVAELLGLITIQQGPGEVMMAMKVRMTEGLSGAELVGAINAFERRLKERVPELRWCFVEPDDHP